jgi:hypothetical protein
VEEVYIELHTGEIVELYSMVGNGNLREDRRNNVLRFEPYVGRTKTGAIY